jgi:predicted enzyme related to lactoylglutathione lyase
MSHPVVHWEIGAADLNALSEFYSKLFGWTVTDADPSYRLVDTGEGGLPGGLMRAPEGAPPYATVYVRVDDLVSTLEQVFELGGVVVVPPTEINATMSFALFADPQGVVVGLLRQVGPPVADELTAPPTS